MLYRETHQGFTAWTGEPIGDIRYPYNIEELWTADELATIGLYKPVEPPVPVGQVVTGRTVQRVNGVVTFVYQTSAAPGPTKEDVYAERDRRLAAGFNYSFGDARGVHRIGTTRDDLIGWDDVTKYAAALIATGNGSAPITILTDTGVVVLTALEWQDVMLGAAAFRQPIWAHSFALTAQDPIPADYASNESYWS